MNKNKLQILVEKVQNGDKESFGEIYDILLEPIYNYVFFKVSHKELAEDITEETFIKVWDNLKKFETKDGVPFSAWVYKIASNLILDYFRKHNKEIFLDPEIEIQDSTDTRTIKEEAEISFNQKLLANSLQKINQDQRDVVILKYVNDMSYFEISIILDKPEGTIRQLHSRAIQNLKKIMKGYFEE